MSDDLRQALRAISPARLLLGRAGAALPTRAWLDFQLAHARARDAVLTPWDDAALARALAARQLPSLRLRSLAPDRRSYLLRPDLGRSVEEASLEALRSLPPADVALIASDGLSASALERQGEPLLLALRGALGEAGLSITPALLVPLARVAASDAVGEACGARLSVIVIGERPGLSAADSASIYLTFRPRPGLTDASRNCVSNIRPPDGLGHAEAAATAARLARAALRLGLSGVSLKDDPRLLG